MARWLFAMTFLAATCAALSAAPVPVVPPDPLPKGATARLGANAFRGPQPFGLAFSADGKKLLAHTNKDGSNLFRDDKRGFSVWDADTGKALKSELGLPFGFEKFKDDPGSGSVRSVLLNDRIVWCTQMQDSPSTVIVAELDGKVIKRFEVEGKPNLNYVQQRAEFARTAVSPSRRYLATTFGLGIVKSVGVFNLETGRQTFSLDIKGGRAEVFFPYGRDVLYVKMFGKPIRRFDPATGKELAELGGLDYDMQHVAESADGKWVVLGMHSSLKLTGGKREPERFKVLEVRDGETGKLTGKIELAGPPVFTAFLGNESLIVQTTQSRTPIGTPTFSRWNVATRKREWEVPAAGHSCVLSADNKRFATIGEQRVFLFNAETGEREADPNAHSGSVGWIAFSDDGKTVSTAGPGEIIIWTTTGQRKQTIPVPELRKADHNFLLYNRNHLGNELAWPIYTEEDPNNPTIVGWDREKNTIGWKFRGQPVPVRLATFDGKRVVCMSHDQKNIGDTILTAYEGPTGKPVSEWTHPRPTGPIRTHCILTGEGRFVVLGGDSPVRIVNAETGKEHGRVTADSAKNRPNFGPSFVVSRDGSKLAVRGQTQVEVYDVKADKLQATFAFKEYQPSWLKFSPDSRLLVISGEPSRPSPVLVWDLSQANTVPKPLVTEPWASATCVAFAPDGKALAVGYADGTSLLWNLTAK